MVEYTSDIDLVFHSLSDPIRRDIIDLVAAREYSIGELVLHFNVSFAAISKHLMVLEEACLIRKRKDGRRRMVSLLPQALTEAYIYLQRHQASNGRGYDTSAD